MSKYDDPDAMELLRREVQRDMQQVLVRRVSELQQRMDLSPATFTEKDQRELDSLKNVLSQSGATKSMLH